MEIKTVVITGSTRGIGHGLAKEFLKRGHQVVLNGRTDIAVEMAIEDLRKLEGEVIYGSIMQESRRHRISFINWKAAR